MKTMNMISRRSFLKAAMAASAVSAFGTDRLRRLGLVRCLRDRIQSGRFFGSCLAQKRGQTFKVGIVNYVDHASLNQIVASVESRLDELGAEKGVTFDYADYYANAQADQSNLNQIGADLVGRRRGCDRGRGYPHRRHHAGRCRGYRYPRCLLCCHRPGLLPVLTARRTSPAPPMP